MIDHVEHIYSKKQRKEFVACKTKNIEDFRVYAMREPELFLKLFLFPGELKTGFFFNFHKLLPSNI